MKKTQSGISAFSGGGQSDATQLYAVRNRIDFVTVDGASIRAVTAIKNEKQIIINNSPSHSVALYPALGDKFFGQAINNMIIIAFGQAIEIDCFDNGEWTISE